MLKKIAIAVVVLLAVGGALLFAWYQVDGQPLPEAGGYLQGAGYTASVEDDGALVFRPASANGHGLMIMHGALIKPLGYARTAAFFAGIGYTVYVPSGALRLSINAVDTAAARMDSFGVTDWVMIGHSMGGFSSLELITRHAPNVKALALWACAMPGDYREVKVPMIFIRGDRDGLLPPDRFTDAQSKLPPGVRYINLPGGNHQGFALYSHQYFDSPAIISADRQIDFANQRTAAFFASLL